MSIHTGLFGTAPGPNLREYWILVIGPLNQLSPEKKYLTNQSPGSYWENEAPGLDKTVQNDREGLVKKRFIT